MQGEEGEQALSRGDKAREPDEALRRPPQADFAQLFSDASLIGKGLDFLCVLGDLCGESSVAVLGGMPDPWLFRRLSRATAVLYSPP